MHSPQALFEYNQLMQQMLATNADYLAISVGVLLSVSGIFYFINLKPFQDNSAVTEKKLEQLLEENKSYIEENRILKVQVEETNALANSTLGKFEALDQKVNAATANLANEISNQIDKVKSIVDKKIDELDWQIAWTEHYMWDHREIVFNAFISLYQCSRIAIRTNNKWQVKLTLDKISYYLDNYKSTLQDDKSWTEYAPKLKSILEKYSGSEYQVLLKQIIAELDSSKSLTTK